MAKAHNHFATMARRIPPPLLTGIGYYLPAVAALYLTRDEGIATLWPSSGILFAALLLAPRSQLKWHIAAAAFASLVANFGAGLPLLDAMGFTVANMAECSLAAWLMRSRETMPMSFTSPGRLTQFCTCAALGAALSATIAVSIIPESRIVFWCSWFATDLLGVLVMTPLILTVHGAVNRPGSRVEIRDLLKITTVFTMVLLVTVFTFWQSSYPLLFLPMLAVLIAASQLGPIGAAGGLLIVAAVSSLAMSMGLGPAPLVTATPIARSLFLQFYLLCVFAASLPIAALLTARARLADKLVEQMRLLELAEGAAHVGHWRLDMSTQLLTWSREVFRIHGLDGNVPPALEDAINAYHPDDRVLVMADMEEAIANRRSFQFTARIVRPDGEVRNVLSRGEIDQITPDGQFGLFGIIQDITAQVLHEAAMENARLYAEQLARDATIMAETDLLTGIANRRRTAFALEQAAFEAARSDRPLAIAMFDIDHFKTINDTYGHHAGDEVLKRVAADAAGELRAGDIVGRFGGEEFVVVLPNTTAQTALLVAERVRHAIETGGSNPRVTISVGVAELAMGETSETLLRRADQALYVAKKEGRNTLRVAA
jgi:diguanylate cyclase (GGDEF)-like protein